jgi:hypothetical protein
MGEQTVLPLFVPGAFKRVDHLKANKELEEAVRIAWSEQLTRHNFADSRWGLVFNSFSVETHEVDYVSGPRKATSALQGVSGRLPNEADVAQLRVSLEARGAHGTTGEGLASEAAVIEACALLN